MRLKRQVGESAHGSQIDTDAMRGAFSKNTDFTDAHGWVFSRIGYSCAAFSGVVLMRRRRDGSARILSHAERNASVEIGEICGRHYAPMALRTGG